mgnify:CR=1 FL=1
MPFYKLTKMTGQKDLEKKLILYKSLNQSLTNETHVYNENFPGILIFLVNFAKINLLWNLKIFNFILLSNDSMNMATPFRYIT